MNRLYSRSNRKQERGKVRREEIRLQVLSHMRQPIVLYNSDTAMQSLITEYQ